MLCNAAGACEHGNEWSFRFRKTLRIYRSKLWPSKIRRRVISETFSNISDYSLLVFYEEDETDCFETCVSTKLHVITSHNTEILILTPNITRG
jgi:hypothetical protein